MNINNTEETKDNSVADVMQTISDGLKSGQIGQVIQVGDEGLTLGLNENGELSETSGEVEEEKPKRIGAFKVKEKYIEFIGAKGDVNFISDSAFIEGKYLAGLGYDDVKFKLTVCDDNTVDFDEVDNTNTTFEQRERLVELISDKTLVSFRNRWCIADLPFTNKLSDNKEINCYLAVEKQKPIDMLYDIFLEKMEASDEQASKIDSLLGLFDDDQVEEQTEEASDAKEESVVVSMESTSIELEVDHTKNYLEESFKKMNEDKIEELKKRVENRKKDVEKFTQEVNYTQKKLNETIEDVNVLTTRLDTMTPKDPENGYIFNISEEVNERLDLDEQTTELIRKKVSQIKSINLEAFMKLFNAGEFHLRLATKDENGVITEVIDYSTLPQDIITKIAIIGFRNVDGEALTKGINSLAYRGDLTWHQLLYKMIKSGFIQEPEFDKICQSSSYGTKTGEAQNNMPHSRLDNHEHCGAECTCGTGSCGGCNNGDNSDIDTSKVEPSDAELSDGVYIKSGIYSNIIELAKQNGVYTKWTDEVMPNRTLEDYLDDYSDRNIVEMFLSDVMPIGINFNVDAKWEEGGLNWRKTKVEIL